MKETPTKARAEEGFTRLEPEREAHNRISQDLEHWLDRYPQPTHDTNVDMRGTQQSVNTMQHDSTTNEAALTAHESLAQIHHPTPPPEHRLDQVSAHAD
eukprot:1135357-Pyramimonas_sp.AAC.1